MRSNGSLDFLAVQLLLSIIFIFLKIPTYNCQFVAHINAKGLKGNISFDIKEETNGSILVIESFIESDQASWALGPKDEDEADKTQSILFDWTLHSNTLPSSALSTCSNDDLGSEILRSELSDNRPITLDRQNRWTLPIKDLKLSTMTSLSSLIWGKSVRLKLSLNSSVDDKAMPGNLPPKPPLPSKPADRLPVLSKPSLNGPLLTSKNVSTPTKPTFAPRPKPSISGRLKVSNQTTFSQGPSLPKSEALIMEATEVQITNSSVDIKLVEQMNIQSEAIIAATRRRIVRLYGKSIVCGNIVDTRSVKTAEAVFESQIAGKVVLRGNEDGTTLIMLNLYHLKSKLSTKHDWKILASDILDNRRHEDQCKYLQVLFDPNNLDDSDCKRSEPDKCRMGDLTKKHGQVQVAGLTKSTRTTLIDSNLPLSALEGSRSLFIVIYELQGIGQQTKPSQKSNILSCAQIRSVNSRKVEAAFNMDGVRGSIKVTQRHSTEPASISYDLFGLEGNIKHQSIRELPLPARSSYDNSKLCTSLGGVFNPNKVQVSPSTNSIRTTVDAFEVGNLSAKHGSLSVIDSEYEDYYMGEYIDLSLDLFGPNTIAGRSIVIHKNNNAEPWVCATLRYVDEPIKLAVANFYYPVIGQISFQQFADDPHAETGVLVEVYNPNGERSSGGHNWMIHSKPALADFYNWSSRCESSGEVYDPLQVANFASTATTTGSFNDLYNRQCQSGMLNEPLRCRSGDTSLKSGFKLSLPLSHLNKSRLFYTDLFLPLSKANSIIGRSVVIYDEHAPVQRGNRLACSSIKLIHPLKASVRSWNSGPSIPSAVLGSIVFEQDSKTQATGIRVDLGGFNGNVENYAIHNVWTMDDREFPCSNDSLYDIYDPYDNEHSLRLPPSAHYGSSATVDRVKVGDLSRKHGTFEGLQVVQKSFADANAPLFAHNSIVGRSIVLRAAVNDFRWVCGNIELDYDKSETRQLIGIASFDEPRSKIAGYVRLFQLEHKDGSLSDTYVQVDLRLQSDGVHELQTSEAHNWAIFVNQVGEDAYIAADEVRCIASGFKWNPYLAQDALESYTSSCTRNEHMACAMGDLGMRHGSLTLGPNNRRAFSDSNLPLAGNYSVMGRSLIIFDNKRPNVKLACANIFPDIHLQSNVVIKRNPSFTVARFVEQMRSLLGAAEWLLVPELRATKSVANGECVQMTIHFYGRRAHQMQVELNNLITLGTVIKSTRIGTDKISTHYKLCRTGQMQLTSSGSSIRGVNLLNYSCIINLLTLIASLLVPIRLLNEKLL